MYRYTNLFLSSSADGYLYCFQFGAITNKAAMTTRVHVLAWMKALSLGVEWLGRMGDRMFNF